SAAERQAAGGIVDRLLLLEMQSAELGSHHDHVGSGRPVADHFRKFQPMYRRIAAHEIHRSPEHVGGEIQFFCNDKVKTRSAHAGAAYRDQVSDLTGIDKS